MIPVAWSVHRNTSRSPLPHCPWSRRKKVPQADPWRRWSRSRSIFPDIHRPRSRCRLSDRTGMKILNPCFLWERFLFPVCCGLAALKSWWNGSDRKYDLRSGIRRCRPDVPVCRIILFCVWEGRLFFRHFSFWLPAVLCG